MMSKECELEHIAKSICDANKLTYIQFIDAGAYKETYHVQDQQHHYALKVFKANNSNERTIREIDAMRRTSCTNIAQLFAVDSFTCREGDFLYIYEEYLAGGSLGKVIGQSTLGKKEIISIGKDLTKALESTYKEHIVHRDIKPDNIMFRSDRSEAVLIDFGLVRDLDATSLTQAFQMRGPGTPLYSAPEQLNNQKDLIDWRTDQFALGITLCVALLGEHPFESGSPAKTVERIASKTPCNDGIKEKLRSVGLESLLNMLEPYPIKRYRTPEQLKVIWNNQEA